MFYFIVLYFIFNKKSKIKIHLRVLLLGCCPCKSGWVVEPSTWVGGLLRIAWYQNFFFNLNRGLTCSVRNVVILSLVLLALLLFWFLFFVLAVSNPATISTTINLLGVCTLSNLTIVLLRCYNSIEKTNRYFICISCLNKKMTLDRFSGSCFFLSSE